MRRFIRMIAAMKLGIGCLLVVWSSLAPLNATPTRTLSVDEQIAGSNATGYAVLRTEKDNLGSYYSYRAKTWLDEFTKDSGKETQPLRTLLLDVSYTVDIDHKDRNTEPEVKEMIHSQDMSLPWASVLQRYPARPSIPWTPEKVAKLDTHPVAGVRFLQTVPLVDGGAIGRVFGQQVATVDWTLAEVMEDTNTIYLRVIKDADDGARESRIVGISPAITKQVRDKAILKPIYLIAGRFPTREEALKEAEALKAKARELKFYGFHPEVWSVWEPTDRIVHVIAEEHSMEMIESGNLANVEAALGIQLVPVSSKEFRERTRLND